MPHKPMLKYCTAAAALGIGWFVVLLLPTVTREWLLGDTFQNLGCLVVASVIVALMCRKFIRSADTFGNHLLRAAVVPYLGRFVYLSLWIGLLWTRSFLYGGLANVHDTLSLCHGIDGGCRLLLCRHPLWATVSIRDEIGITSRRRHNKRLNLSAFPITGCARNTGPRISRVGRLAADR
jgi:hypothetical protein